MMARAVAAGMTAAISACGGGGGGNGGVLPLGGMGGLDPDGQGDGGNGAIMPIDQRSAATLRVHDKYMELVAGNNADPFEALVAWALTQPEYDQAGRGKDTFWARFKDGRHFVYTDNWRTVDPLQIPQAPQPVGRMRSAGLAAAAAAGSGKAEIPETELAVILSADGAGEFDAVKPFQQQASDALKERGWTIHPDHAVTVDSLMALGSKKIGVLYMACHSAELGPTGEKQFGIFSETRATAENEAKYEALFKAGLLIYHRDRNRDEEARGGNPPVYGITDGFIRNYLQFADASLVVTLACHTGSPEGAPLRDALKQKGAGTIVAWDGSSNPFGALSMVYMFDRLTGANAFNPGKPANRAFALEDVWTFMREKTDGGIRPNLLITPYINKQGKVDPLGGEAAYIKRFEAGFDLSNPVISELSVDRDDRLYIHGNFGTEPGEVSIGGTKVAVETWEDDKIQLVLPTGESDPPGSFGEVIVTARKRTSNRRVLTSWRGTIEYTLETVPYPGTTGLLSSVVTVELHLRGDAHELRTAVDGELKRSVRHFIPASDTKVSYKASGTNSGGLITTTWSGSGSLPYKGTPDAGNWFAMNTAIDVVARLLKISPAMLAKDLLVVTTTTVGDSKETKTFLPLHTNALGYLDAFGGDTVAYGTAFSLDAGRNVAPYDKRLSVPNWPSEAHMRVKTDGMTANPPFDDTVGR